MVTLNDLLNFFAGSDRVRFFRDGRCLYTGYLGMVNSSSAGHGLEEIGLTGDEEVKGCRVKLEIRHREWKERGLMEPLEPEELPQYRMADLQMDVYHIITIAPEP